MFIIYILYPSTFTSLGLVTLYLKLELYRYSRARVAIMKLRVLEGLYCTKFQSFAVILARVTSTLYGRTVTKLL
jgi:hypothetical protein